MNLRIDLQRHQDCYRICRMIEEDGPPVIMFNPRLASGDVGIGLNVRRMQQNFLRCLRVPSVVIKHPMNNISR